MLESQWLSNSFGEGKLLTESLISIPYFISQQNVTTSHVWDLRMLKTEECENAEMSMLSFEQRSNTAGNEA